MAEELKQPQDLAHTKMIFDGRWKYIRCEGFEPILFDLYSDPDELIDISGSTKKMHREARSRLEMALESWAMRHHSRITATEELLDSQKKATELGKTMLVSKFVEDAYNNNERAILFAYEESRAQLLRNATSWGIDFEKMESDGLLKIICAYPESTGLEDHLQIIKTQINHFKPKRMAIDSPVSYTHLRAPRDKRQSRMPSSA